MELLLTFGELIVEILDFVLELCLGFLHLECADDQVVGLGGITGWECGIGL